MAVVLTATASVVEVAALRANTGPVAVVIQRVPATAVAVVAGGEAAGGSGERFVAGFVVVAAVVVEVEVGVSVGGWFLPILQCI